MTGTNEERDVRRAEVWLRRSGGMTQVSPAAWELLVRRLAERRRVGLLCLLPAGVVAGVLIAWSAAEVLLTPTTTIAWPHAYAYLYGVVLAVLGMAEITWEELVARRDRRLAAELPGRVSRSHRVPLRAVLGPLRTAFLGLALGVETAIGAALLGTGPGWLVRSYLVAFTGLCGLVLLGLRRALGRATVAVDATSLALDERLRSEEVFAAIGPLYLFLLALPAPLFAQSAAGWLILPWSLGGMVLLVLHAVARSRHPWPSVAVQVPWPAPGSAAR